MYIGAIITAITKNQEFWDPLGSIFIWFLDVDECEDSNLYKCPERTKCVNQQGDYTCQCISGYESTLKGISQAKDIKCKGELIY